MIENIFKTWWPARKVFKRPRIKLRIGRGIGHIRPGNNFLSFQSMDVLWKFKDETPRFEFSPQAALWILGKYQVSLELDISEDFEEDQYWEQLLWTEYCIDMNPNRTLTEEDWELAKSTWPWTSNGKSTWKDEFHV